MIQIKLKRQGKKEWETAPSKLLSPAVLKAYFKMIQGMNIRPGVMQMRIVNEVKKKEVILMDIKIVIDPLVSPNYKAPEPFKGFKVPKVGKYKGKLGIITTLPDGSAFAKGKIK